MARILIVDDDAATCRRCMVWLSPGNECVSAGCAGDGLPLLESSTFDLIVLGYHLPDGSGLDMLARARQHGVRMPGVLLVTGYGTYQLAAEAVDLGVTALAGKPLEKESFLRKVHSCMSGRRSASTSGDGRYDRIVAYIGANIGRKISLEAVLDVAYMSRSTFHRWLKRVRGVSFSDLVAELRLAAVEDLLATTDVAIREIASLTGFRTHSYLSRWFRCRTGLSPKQFRASSARQERPEADKEQKPDDDQPERCLRRHS